AIELNQSHVLDNRGEDNPSVYTRDTPTDDRDTVAFKPRPITVRALGRTTGLVLLHARNVHIGRAQDVNAILMGLLDFAVLDPARGHADVSHAVDDRTDTVTGAGTGYRESGLGVVIGVGLGRRLHDRQHSGGTVDAELAGKHRGRQQGTSGNGNRGEFLQTFHSSLLRHSVNYLWSAVLSDSP